MISTERKKRFFKRKVGETTVPKERLFEHPILTWAQPWTRIIDPKATTGFFVTGACYRGEIYAKSQRRPGGPVACTYAMVAPASVIKPKREGWYWFAGDAEGIASDRELAKALCDLELNRKRICLHEPPTGCIIEDDDGPPVNYEEVA